MAKTISFLGGGHNITTFIEVFYSSYLSAFLIAIAVVPVLSPCLDHTTITRHTIRE
jgi:cadmium resistance protein CadD (predicted permease)